MDEETRAVAYRAQEIVRAVTVTVRAASLVGSASARAALRLTWEPVVLARKERQRHEREPNATSIVRNA